MNVMATEIMFSASSHKLCPARLARVRINGIGLPGIMPGVRDITAFDAGILLDMRAATIRAF